MEMPTGRHDKIIPPLRGFRDPNNNRFYNISNPSGLKNKSTPKSQKVKKYRKGANTNSTTLNGE
jgi:hypothetical protein